MKFVKENLVPLICGLVVLLAVGALFWPIGSWVADLQGQMKDRLDQVALVEGMKSPVTIPEGATVDTVADNVIAAETAVQKEMHDQQQAITDEAAAKNRERRVTWVGPRTNGHEVPLLNNEPMDHYLPEIDRKLSKPFGFKIPYDNLWKVWTERLVQPSNGAVGLPIAEQDISNAIQAEQAKLRSPGGGTYSGGNDASAQVEMARRLASNRAAEIHMYVDIGAFSRQPWVATSLTPTAPQIFDGLVESWFQQDVVSAILSVNKGSPNVGASPIKRLEKINVGSGAQAANAVQYTMGGLQSVTSPTAATASAPMFTVNPAGTAPPANNGIDTTKTMTGRVGDQNFDVVMMNISIDVDPAYQNKFIDALYRQNNGYTVLNIRSWTVDPLDAASRGYLFGDVQVVHLEILVEGLLFRNWTAPIMPTDTKTALGVPATPATPG